VTGQPDPEQEIGWLWRPSARNRIKNYRQRFDGATPMDEQNLQPLIEAVDLNRVRAMVDAIRARTAIDVVDDTGALDIAARATVPDAKRPGAVVFPTTVEDVVTVVRIANEFLVPIWPVSKGRNWGYGSATPAVENTVVLHLERMNRILEIDEDLAYAVIEPGVTYRQLKEHLVRSGSRLWCDCTDGPPEGSVLGNALERGMGVTPYADHFATLCGLEVVLADGSIVRTGGGDSGRCPTWNTHKWGVGPYIEGLFSQSNFGIVVKAGMWLFPEPESYCAFIFDLTRDEDLPQLIDIVREFTLAGLLTAGVHMVNDICALAVISQYPPGLAERVSRLPDDVLVEQRQRFGVSGWSFGGGIHGTKEWVKNVQRRLRRRLNGMGRLTFITNRTIFATTQIERAVSTLLPGTRLRLAAEWLFRRLTGKPLELIPVTRHVHAVMRGEPTEYFVRHVYFKSSMSKPAEAHPDRDNIGAIWFAPALPMRGTEIQQMLESLRALYLEYGFDFYVALLAQNSRTLIMLLCIFYSKENAAETERAKALYAAVKEKVFAAGLQPYRTGVQSPTGYPIGYAQILKLLKAALDPNGILAPGKSRIGVK
jgi:4-cresol dehydrogenase (hydroxylating)